MGREGRGALNGQIILQWLTPCLLLGFGGGFVVLWLQDRARRAAALFAVSYGAGGLAFAVELLAINNDVVSLSRLAEDSLYVASALFFGLGHAARRGIAPSHLLFGLAVVAALATNVWFSTVDPDMGRRTLALSLATAALMGLGLLSGWGRRWTDRLVFATAILLVGAILGNAFVNAPTLSGTTAAIYETTLFSAVLNLAVSVLGATMAMTLLMEHALGLIGDLRRESVEDALTGLLNRRGFEAQAESLVGAVPGRGVLIVADLDRFKTINDTFGHAAGDRVIRALAETLRAGLPGATIGRLGGEEFCAVLPLADVATGRMLAEGVRLGLTQTAHAVLPERNVTASFGLAPFTCDFAATFALADAALYAAKAGGRDRVMCHYPQDEATKVA